MRGSLTVKRPPVEAKQSVFSARRNQEDGIKEADHGLYVAYKGENRQGIKSNSGRKATARLVQNNTREKDRI